jgi:hypothetical protein
LVPDKSALHPSKQKAVLKMIKNICGFKDASKTWADHLSQGLIIYSFQKSAINACLCYERQHAILPIHGQFSLLDTCFTPKRENADNMFVHLEKARYVVC